MKQILKNILYIAVTSAVAFSCKKEEVRAVLTPGPAPVLTASAYTMTLTQANAANLATTFNWSAADYGFKAPVNYTLQIARRGANFPSSATLEIPMGTNLAKSFLVGELNKELLKLFPAGAPLDLDVRVKSDVGTSVAPVYSNVLPVRITPYRDIVNYEFPQALRLAGNYQGWNPGAAPKIVDKAATGSTGRNYDGYINFNNATPEFKMVKGSDWSAGDFGSAGPNKLGNGGPNLTLTQGAGVYRITANTVDMTWTATKINTWGLIGSFNGWSTSLPMTMNADGTYTVTQVFSAGDEFKFRANNDWAINLGDDGADNVPEYNGANIKITTAGNYEVKLDLTVAGNYSYTLRRL